MVDILELMATSEDGVYAVDSQQKIIFWSQGAERVLGYSPQDVLGQYCYDAIGARGIRGNLVCVPGCAIINAAKSSGQAPSHYCTLRNKGGEIVWVHMNHVVIPSENKELESIVHMFRDVTEYVEAQQLVQKILSYLAASPLAPRAQKRALLRTTRRNIPQLTHREVEVLSLLAQGNTAKAIADRLVISPATARHHVQHILSKLGVHSTLEAVAYAYRHSML
ncbi:MAG: LuxR C-terminal-related transcriptional regulator [Dehalococcoidia bacterium]